MADDITLQTHGGRSSRVKVKEYIASDGVFGLVLLALMVLSFWLGTYIPEDIFESFINPFEYSATACICFFGCWVMVRHHEGILIRKSWAAVLFIWGLIDVTLLILRFGFQITAVGATPANPLYNATVTIGNILAWLLFIYPTQTLRPGWLTWRRAVLLVAPIALLGVVDYYVDANLLVVIMLYPMIIFLMLCRHVRSYRQWCEDNFSSIEHIDVQGVVRYLTILALLGLAFYFICFWYLPNRMFTQQWMLLLILAYGTEQILFRQDPWAQLLPEDSIESAGSENCPPQLNESASACQPAEESTTVAYRRTLEQWMESAKPYLNPDFQLVDLRAVLPLNRTYLSRFIRDEYGCTFYQFVNTRRIDEAKRLMQEHPTMTIEQVATRSGFSSRSVFSRIFTKETGCSPREWSAQFDSEKRTV